MRKRTRATSAAGFVGLVVLALITPRRGGAADADPSCYEAYEQAQIKRREGDPRKAREFAQHCARVACPTFVRGDCLNWSADADKAVPTIVLRAATDEGDATDATVTMDQVLLTSQLNGKTIEVDPGAHVFVFEWKTQTREVRLLVNEGEKGRSVVADFRTPKTLESSTPRLTRRPVTVMTWITAGTAVAAFGAFGAFAILGNEKRNHLSGTCAPYCTSSDTSPARTDYVIADVFLAAGVVSAVTAMILHLARPEVPVASGEASQSHLTWGLTPLGFHLGMNGNLL
jgi:hypothetical protein